jgi:hypothetical protein
MGKIIYRPPRRTYECDVGDHNSYRTYPIFGVGPFATREEATEEARKHEPQHGDLLMSNANWPTRKPRQSEKAKRNCHGVGKPDAESRVRGVYAGMRI